MQYQSKKKMKPWTTTILVVFAMSNLPSHAQNSPKDYVDAHNTARSEVGVGPVEWNSTLESYAVNYANQRAGDCQLIHSQGPYGENMYTGYGQGYSDGVDAVRLLVQREAILRLRLEPVLGRRGLLALHADGVAQLRADWLCKGGMLRLWRTILRHMQLRSFWEYFGGETLLDRWEI